MSRAERVMYSHVCDVCGEGGSWQYTADLAWDAAEDELGMDAVGDRDVCWGCRGRAAGGES